MYIGGLVNCNLRSVVFSIGDECKSFLDEVCPEQLVRTNLVLVLQMVKEVVIMLSFVFCDTCLTLCFIELLYASL